MRKLELVGEKFGRWAVKNLSVCAGNRGQVKWDCLCDCGNRKAVSADSLRAGLSKSCGCLAKDGINKTHGMSKSRIYRTYRHMLNRCSNENVDSYYLYGARGISVCKEWLDFNAFYQWAMNNGYAEDLTIDRKNNDIGYGPANCQWSTPLEQARNRRNNVLDMGGARQIREMRQNGKRNIDIAKQLGISASVACDVYKNKIWVE